jgi:hypothetical protein
MTDTFNVTAAYSANSYSTGNTMVVTISGNDVLTTTSNGVSGNLSITVLAADGATEVLTLAPTTVVITTSTPESVKMTAIADTSGRVWTIANSGLTATATA